MKKESTTDVYRLVAYVSVNSVYIDVSHRDGSVRAFDHMFGRSWPVSAPVMSSPQEIAVSLAKACRLELDALL